jgi:hypothetical protein
MNTLYKFFEDYNKLFFWLLLLLSFILTADIVGLLFFNNRFVDLFTKTNISKLLIIFIVQIVIIIVSKVIYYTLKILLPNENKNTSSEDSEYYFSSTELLNKSVKENNQTMYNYYLSHKEELKSEQNQKQICFSVILIFIINLFIENSLSREIVENFHSFTLFKKTFILIINFFGLLGILVLFKSNNKSNYTEIIKKDKFTKNEKIIKN